MAPGDCSPSAHRTASVTFDFPDPFGPTITLTPGPNSSRVRSGKDLKPFSVIDFRYTPSSLHRVQRGLRGFLLGVLLASPRAAADLDSLDRRADREHTIVRGPLFGDHRVADELPAPREALLERRRVVDRMLERGLGLRCERVADR